MRTIAIRWLRALGMAGLMAAAWPAHALATLDVWFTDASCSITHLGVVTTVPCTGVAGLSVTALLGPGDRAQVDAVLHYHYTDQGLPVSPYSAIQMDAVGSSKLPLSFEAGALIVQTALCQGRYCGGPPWREGLGTPGFPPLVLGANATPDDITGQLSVFTAYALDATAGNTMTLTASLAALPLTWSGTVPMVTPIPEPSTWALLLLGMGLVGAAACRRR